MFYVFLADGFEEVEALSPVDLLRRAGIEVKTVGVLGKTAVSSHGVPVICDLLLRDIELGSSLEGVILPGGMPGAKHLDESAGVQRAIDWAASHKKLLCAICAAPFILGKKGLLNGKKATCFPGFEGDLAGALLTDEPAVTDGNIITACGAGAAWQFSAAIVAKVCGAEKANELLRKIQWRV